MAGRRGRRQRRRRARGVHHRAGLGRGRRRAPAGARPGAGRRGDAGALAACSWTTSGSSSRGTAPASAPTSSSTAPARDHPWSLRRRLLTRRRRHHHVVVECARGPDPVVGDQARRPPPGMSRASSQRSAHAPHGSERVAEPTKRSPRRRPGVGCRPRSSPRPRSRPGVDLEHRPSVGHSTQTVSPSEAVVVQHAPQRHPRSDASLPRRAPTRSVVSDSRYQSSLRRRGTGSGPHACRAATAWLPRSRGRRGPRCSGPEQIHSAVSSRPLPLHAGIAW